MKKIVISCLFFFFTFFIVYNTFIPFRFDYGWRDLGTQIGRIEWRPFTEQVALTDIAGNIILFIPFGFLLYMWLHYAGSRHPILWSAAASATLSFFIEFFQLFIQIRNTATHDLINNTLGGLIGALCAAVYAVKISSISRKIFYNLLGNQPFLLTVVIIGLFQSVSAMMPFTVSITVSDLKRSIKTTNIMPLGHQSVERLLFNPSGKGSGSSFDFISFVEDLIFWAVTGYLLMLCYRRYWQHKPYGKILLVGLPIVYFPLMEFSQLFITSRYTDINDVISGYLGIATGMILYFLTRSMLRKGHRINLDLLTNFRY